ncbi:MAG TPA: endonuclease/exonuclease/phosphatase family protein [Polyangiaceae bacterium]
MPFYYGLKALDSEPRKRAIGGIHELRRGLEAGGVPRRNLSETLLLATWNIREFDSATYGERVPESFYYIAEIVDHFDLVAIQEVREDLRALKRLQALLGGWWKYIVTDVTIGKSGNGERLAFLYDSRKVSFSGLAGEVVLPSGRTGPVLQFARTPFVCGFKAGWSSFSLCTVHVYYGTSKKDDPRRVTEIQQLAQTLADRGKADPRRIGEPENLILLGDFNIFDRKDVTFTALTDAGFTIPEALQQVPGSNVAKNKHYDQIAFMTRPRRFAATGKAGVFDFFEHVFRSDQAAEYSKLLEATGGEAAGFEKWRTYQMSDHLLMWCEVDIDFSKEYLDDLARDRDVERPEPAPGSPD